MASGDSQHIASGHLDSADTTSLKAMLAQAEALSRNIRQVLAKQSQPISQSIADTATPSEAKQKASPNNSTMGDNSSIVAKDTVGDSEVGDSTTDDSAMQID